MTEVPIFVVHFGFDTLAGRELFTQPLLKNNKQPVRISFNRFDKIERVVFHPDSDAKSYHATAENGYVYFNQYPGPRKDLTPEEGSYRYNLGVEYPWYQAELDKLPGNMQYEYMDLVAFLNRCVRGLEKLTLIVTDAEETQERREKAAAKGKEIAILYQRTINEFKGTYPDYTVNTVTTENSTTVSIIAVE